MEYARLWAPISVLGLIMIGFFCYSYLQKVDEANAHFQTAKVVIEEYRSSLNAKHILLEKRKVIAADYQALEGKVESAKTRLKNAKQKVDETNTSLEMAAQDLTNLVAWLEDACSKARAELVGTKLSELKLSTGRVLKDAVIRKVEDGSITAIHSEGITSIRTEELPEEITVKLGLGSESLLKKLQQLEQSMKADTAKPDVGSISKPVVPRSAFKADRPALADEAQLAALKRRQDQLQIKLSLAKQALQESKDKMTAIQFQIGVQKKNGRPVSALQESYENLRIEAEVATNAAQLISTEMASVAREISLLTVKKSS